MGLTASGSSLQMWYKPAAGSWTQVGTPRTDSTYLAGGYLGVKIQQSGATVVGLDSFGGATNTAYPQDSSGNGNHTTTIAGTPTYGVVGALETDPSSTAIQFGSTEYFTAPDHATLDFGDVFTLEAWVKLSTLAGAEMIVVGKGQEAGGSPPTGPVLSIESNRVSLTYEDFTAVATSSITIADTTTWHHCVVTKDGATSKVYLDGVDVTNLVTNGTFQNTTVALAIGANIDVGVAYGMFQGYIDEVAVYGTALSAERVLAHYEAALVQQDVIVNVTVAL